MAANVSGVGTFPAQVVSTSGSPPRSPFAHGQMSMSPMPGSTLEFTGRIRRSRAVLSVRLQLQSKSSHSSPASRTVNRMPLFHHSGALGDFLLSMPLIRAVRRRFGDGHWTLAVPEGPARLVRRILPHSGRVTPGAAEFAPLFARKLDREQVARILDRHGGLVGFLPRARDLTAILRTLQPSLPVVLVEPLPLAVASGRSIEAVLEDAIVELGEARRSLGPRAFALDLGELPSLERPLDITALQVLPGGHPFALVHIGASDPRKAPPRDQLEGLRDRLARRGIEVVWVLGPVEIERGVAPPGGVALDAPDLVALAHAMQRACLYVGGDTGPTHLASALGCRTISLHLIPNPLWRPRGVAVEVVTSLDRFEF